MPHILFLMSDTGGGHRAAARAIEAALHERQPGTFTMELVDVWKEYAPYPLNKQPEMYSGWVNNSPWSYSAQFRFNNWIMQNWLVSRLYCRSVFPRMKRLFAEHPADLIVSVHSVFVRPGIYTLRKLNLKQPFITVITDYALPTVLWYHPQVDRCLVPTEPAYQLGLRLGMSPQKMALTGAPVHPKFSQLTLTKAEARAQLGWQTDKPVVMLIGGGDGIGQLVENARAIDAKDVDCELAIIAGRNEGMKAALNAIQWRRTTRIYGFVDNIQVLMRAADLLITKAGPATITEAAIMGLPLVISGAIQYQETPNTDYVVAHNAGVYAPGPDRVANAVQEIMANNGALLHKLAAGVQTIAQPDAIWKIADEIRAFA